MDEQNIGKEMADCFDVLINEPTKICIHGIEVEIYKNRATKEEHCLATFENYLKLCELAKSSFELVANPTVIIYYETTLIYCKPEEGKAEKEQEDEGCPRPLIFG